MAALATIRDGLKTRLETITGVRPYDTVPDKPEVPCAIVVPAPDGVVDYHTTMNDGLVTWRFDIIVLVSRTSDRGGQDKLDGYINPSGSTSIKAAIEADRTLAAAVYDAHVTGVSEYGSFEFNAIEYFGARFAVTVFSA